MAAARRADLVLASGSPRRHRLLIEAGIPHEVLAVGVDETIPPDQEPGLSAVMLAERKARRAGDLRPRSWILAADTLVVSSDRILGKPTGEEVAREMLRELSGGKHRVVTGVCLYDPRDGHISSRLVETTVVFRELDAEEIDVYVASGAPFDKAGGYGIQGAAGGFVVEIDGPYDNVVGLPVNTVREMLEAWR